MPVVSSNAEGGIPTTRASSQPYSVYAEVHACTESGQGLATGSAKVCRHCGQVSPLPPVPRLPHAVEDPEPSRALHPHTSLCSVLGGAVFHEDIVSSGAGGLIAVQDICFSSTSEADLLPFYGRCYVGYIPTGGNVMGLSKAARLAAYFGHRCTKPTCRNDLRCTLQVPLD